MTLIQGVAPRTAKRQIELNATPACAESVGGAFSVFQFTLGGAPAAVAHRILK